MDCRGHEQRVRLAKDWTIKPVAHIKLINGKVIPGDAGGTIKDSYFIFECTHKTEINKVKYIHCGKTVAKDFSKIIEQPLPEIFNPLKSDCTEGVSCLSENGNTRIKWNEARKQLYNATMILIVAWDADEGTPLFEIKEKIELLPHVPPPLFLVRAVNTILSKGTLTLTEILEHIKKNNNIKDFDFSSLVEILNDNEIEQYFK